MTRPYVSFRERHGLQDIPVLRPIEVKVADVEDAALDDRLGGER